MTYRNRVIDQLTRLAARTQENLSRDVDDPETPRKNMTQKEVHRKVINLIKRLAVESLFGNRPWPMTIDDRRALVLAFKALNVYVPAIGEDKEFSWEMIWSFEHDVGVFLAFAGFWVDDVIVGNITGYVDLKTPVRPTPGSASSRSSDAMYQYYRELRDQTQLAFYEFCLINPPNNYLVNLVAKVLKSGFSIASA